MTVSHSAAVRTSLATAILTAIDADVGAGNLVYRTAGDVAVATLAFSAPAGVVAGAVLTFNSISEDSDAAGNASPIAKATLEDNSGDIVCIANNVTLTGNGGDIELSSLTVANGDTVQTSSLTYTAPV